MDLSGDLIERSAKESARLLALYFWKTPQRPSDVLGDANDPETLHDFPGSAPAGYVAVFEPRAKR